MATLVYCDGDGASARLELMGSVTVGSADGCTIVSRSGGLEARHARIFEEGGAFWVEALSENGEVFVESEKVTQRQVAIGEVVVVGNMLLRVDDSNGASRPLIAAVELLRLLEVSQQRQRELEDERNALGRRVGELHAELAEERSQAAVVIGPPRDAVEYDAIDSTAPMAAGFAPDLDQLAEKARQATLAIAELEQKLQGALASRAQLTERIVEAEAAAASAEPGEREIRSVELLSLEAQLAMLEQTCESRRAKLEARRRELAALRSRLEADPRSPRRTREYAVADSGDDSTKLAELKERFETEFTRAVTLQRKLKTAEARIAQLESDLEVREAELEELEGDRETAVEARQAIEQRLREVQAVKETGAEPHEIDRLTRRVGDLEKLLEAAKREVSRRSRESAKARDTAAAAETRRAELEAAAAAADTRAKQTAARIAELEATLASRDGELASAREKVAELSEKLEVIADVEQLSERLAEVETALARAEKARDNAQADRREADVRLVDAESKARELEAKLALAERRAAERRSEIERLGLEIEKTRGQLVEAREEISRLESSTNRENTQVIRLERKLEDVRRESDAEIEMLGDRVKELERDLDRALDAEQVALARSDAEQAGKQEEIDRLEAALVEVRDELATTTEQLASIRHELSESQERADALAGERDALADRLAKVGIEHAAAIAALEGSLENVRTSHAAEIAGARAELNGLRGRLGAAESKVTELENQRRALLVERDRASGLERELETARESLREMRSQLGELTEKLADAESGETANDDLRSRVVALASQNAQISAELMALGEQKSRVEIDLAAARAETKALQNDLARLRGELTDTARKNSELENSNSDLTRRYEQVAEKLERASIDMEALRGDVDRDALERECRKLRERVADLELQLSDDGMIDTTESLIARPDTLSDDVELTAVAETSPALIEHTAALREAIADLRRQMRTAADEAVMLEGGESIEIINVALSSAVARVEAARDAIRGIVEILGLE